MLQNDRQKFGLHFFSASQTHGHFGPQPSPGTSRYHHPSARVSQLGLDETTTVDVARKVWLRPAEQRLGRHVAWPGRRDVQHEGEIRTDSTVVEAAVVLYVFPLNLPWNS